MKEILIFAGTTEGRRLSECLAASEIPHTVCVATEYGEIVLKESPFMKVHQGRMDSAQIKEFIEHGGFAAVVDATHPYAKVVTENIRTAVQGMDIAYLRLKRETAYSAESGETLCEGSEALDSTESRAESSEESGALDGGTRKKSFIEPKSAVRYFNNSEECAGALEAIEGNILLTTGSKELAKFCVNEALKGRLYVRVLPSAESLESCLNQGIRGRQIIAMQGPFTTEMNEAMIKQFDIACLVTKQSGAAGGYAKKIEAAKNAKIPAYVIGCRTADEGYSFKEVCERLEAICGQKINAGGRLEIILAGIGMGSENCLTKEVKANIDEADILLGAPRMLEGFSPRLEKKPFYLAEQIIPYLVQIQREHPAKNLKAVVLFSGDSGFYSGCQALYRALMQEVRLNRLNADVRILPGISSVAYLAACIGESYHDAAILSMHGKALKNIARRISTENKTFILMSGAGDVVRLGEALADAGMTGCEIIAGFMLSYPEQQIIKMTPEQCAAVTEEGLYTCFVKNPDAAPKRLTHGRSDEEFIRDRVPMTKEEVRQVSICKLRLYKGAVVYDIGSGTGSIAVEAAGLSDDIEVYAIEQRSEAASLISRNKEKFGLENITVIEAKAPEGLNELPQATHAFIGGSGGNLGQIIRSLYDINPSMRVVINAISLETLGEIKELLSLYPVKNEELVQLQASRAKKAGQYHLMQAENPVWICAFEFINGEEI